jgi:hypothetical protein
MPGTSIGTLDLHAIEQSVTEHEQIDFQRVLMVDEVERIAGAKRVACIGRLDIELGARAREPRLFPTRRHTNGNVGVVGRSRLADERAGE